ncbi:hypothetical protein L596_001307 [Steinernema carpocapsae]|uniref:Uncharacterized protein n=1 Tax=Steinernema carpocapsae TaxID=34508 RepID=A0A4U8UKV8_STECR|nr:hypothetical protein L596_001307 [Steinernema carpocapsae]
MIASPWFKSQIHKDPLSIFEDDAMARRVRDNTFHEVVHLRLALLLPLLGLVVVSLHHGIEKQIRVFEGDSTDRTGHSSSCPCRSLRFCPG